MNKQDMTWLCEKQTPEEIEYINFMADFIALSEDIRIYKEVNGTIKSRFPVPKTDSYFDLYEDGERSGSMFIIDVVKIESEKDLEKVPSDVIAKFIRRRKTNPSLTTYFDNVVGIPDCFVKCNVVENNGDEHEEWCVRTYHGNFTML